MCIHKTVPRLKIFIKLEEDFCGFLEENGLSYAAARQLAKLAVSLLRGLKKSLSRLRRTYFPEFSVKDLIKYLNRLRKKFQNINKNLLDRIQISWDMRRRMFVICDDYLIPRYGKKTYRVGEFRDPVTKGIRLGHNVVNTIIACGGIEFTVDFALQPKGSRIPKTKRALNQLLQTLSILRRHGRPEVRIRVLMDGGYTNRTVLPALRKQGVKYIGTVRRDKLCLLFGSKEQINALFPHVPHFYLNVDGKTYYYLGKTLNLTDWGRHQVFLVRRPGEKKVKFLLTNDLKMTPRTFLRCLHDRWWIEQSHRDLKQFCGLNQLFVWTKPSVEGRIGLSYLLKNFLALLIANAGLTMREYPSEELVEKEFCHVEQFLIQAALNAGFLEQLEMC